MYKSFDFEKIFFFDQRGQLVKYGWFYQMVVKKIEMSTQVIFH